MWVEDAHRHAVLGIDPGNKVEGKIVTARRAAQEKRPCRDNCCDQNNRRSN
jgi:hypothetical protein